MLKHLLKLWQPIVRFPTYFMVPKSLLLFQNGPFFLIAAGEIATPATVLCILCMAVRSRTRNAGDHQQKIEVDGVCVHIIAKCINAPNV
jgi:hypothetical protein